GEECLIGNGATVLDGAKIGPRAMVAAGALVTPETEIPEGTLALGAPAKGRGPLAGTPAERWVRANPEGYQALAQRHKASVQPCRSHGSTAATRRPDARAAEARLARIRPSSKERALVTIDLAQLMELQREFLPG